MAEEKGNLIRFKSNEPTRTPKKEKEISRRAEQISA